MSLAHYNIKLYKNMMTSLFLSSLQNSSRIPSDSELEVGLFLKDGTNGKAHEMPSSHRLLALARREGDARCLYVRRSPQKVSCITEGLVNAIVVLSLKVTKTRFYSGFKL